MSKNHGTPQVKKETQSNFGKIGVGELENLKVISKIHYIVPLFEMGRTNYSPGHNILELYNILVQIRFTTSKTKLDI